MPSLADASVEEVKRRNSNDYREKKRKEKKRTRGSIRNDTANRSSDVLSRCNDNYYCCGMFGRQRIRTSDSDVNKRIVSELEREQCSHATRLTHALATATTCHRPQPCTLACPTLSESLPPPPQQHIRNVGCYTLIAIQDNTP